MLYACPTHRIYGEFKMEKSIILLKFLLTVFVSTLFSYSSFATCKVEGSDYENISDILIDHGLSYEQCTKLGENPSPTHDIIFFSCNNEYVAIEVTWVYQPACSGLSKDQVKFMRAPAI